MLLEAYLCTNVHPQSLHSWSGRVLIASLVASGNAASVTAGASVSSLALPVLELLSADQLSSESVHSRCERDLPRASRRGRANVGHGREDTGVKQRVNVQAAGAVRAEGS